MARWAALEQDAPELAAEGRRLIYQFGPGLGFLATVRGNGGVRLHPVCPVIANGGLYAFIIPSPKRDDLLRRGHYALHAFTGEATDDEFSVLGHALPIAHDGVRAAVIAAYHRSAEQEAHSTLFELDVERCLLVRYRERGDPHPHRAWWHAPR
jgi:hypothetical protein